MNAHSSMLHIRMDNELKAKATEALAAMGLTASDAVRLLFHRIAADQAFPLELKVPNAETRVAMAEAKDIIAAGKTRFANADEMFAELEKDSDQ
jgi:DNA-damage-inducible protein J